MLSSYDLFEELVNKEKIFSNKIKERVRVNKIFNQINFSVNNNLKKFIKMSDSRYKSAKGGIKINEPALDLGIMLAVASSFKNVPIPNDTIAIGEVGLTGEVRSVNQIEKRIKEAEKLGFKKCIIPESNKKVLKDNYKLDIIGVQNIIDAMRELGLRK